jgi:uncharacterized protein YfaS (alpha-2-macroglobulin family)
MPIIRRQVVAGGTASIKLTIRDFDTLAALAADSNPTVDIYDPRGTIVVSNSPSSPIGGGVYVYNHSTSESSIKGTYRAIFNYSIIGVHGTEDAVYQVV